MIRSLIFMCVDLFLIDSEGVVENTGLVLLKGDNYYHARQLQPNSSKVKVGHHMIPSPLQKAISLNSTFIHADALAWKRF